MRRSSLILVLLSIACSKTESSEPSSDAQVDKPPTAAEPELETEGEQAAQVDAREQCVASCIEASTSAAANKPAAVIEADCRAECARAPTSTDAE